MTDEKKPIGRPRNPANTRLIDALINRQDSMSKRTAAKIALILSTHVSAEAAEIRWRGIRRELSAALEAIPVRAAELIPAFADPANRRVLEDEIGQILAELPGGPDDGALLPEPPREEGPPPVKRSRTLAEARTQSAELASFLMDLRGRIAPYRGPGR